MDRIKVKMCVATKVSIDGDALFDFGNSQEELEKEFEAFDDEYQEDWNFCNRTFTFEQTPDGLKLVQVGY